MRNEIIRKATVEKLLQLKKVDDAYDTLRKNDHEFIATEYHLLEADVLGVRNELINELINMGWRT